MQGRRSLGVVFVVASACKPVEPIALDLDAAVRQGWVDYGTEVDWAPVFEALQGGVDLAAVADKHVEAELTRLTPEEQAVAALVPADGVLPDPSRARGLLYVGRFPCDEAALVDILTYPDQNAIYDVYDAYSRAFRGERDPFRTGDVDLLEWDGHIETSIPLVGSYVYDFVSGVERVVVPETHASAGQNAYLARTFMISPAVWNGPNKAMPQDYQMEFYVPTPDGDYLHVYGFWREMDLGALGTMDTEGVARITLDQIMAWDRKTAAACEDGGWE